jgi:hypothetical protein
LKAMDGTSRSSSPAPRALLEKAMMIMTRTFIAWFGLGVPIALAAVGQPAQRQSLDVFAKLGLTPQQVTAIDEGRPVAKVLSWGGPSEVYVFGAVYVSGSPFTYLKAARDIKGLSGARGYLGIGELPATATVADLKARLPHRAAPAWSRCRSVCPSIYSVTMKGRPLCSPKSWTTRMFGWLSADAERASL